MRVALLALVLLAPGALALDAFPDESSLAATEASFLVRVPRGGALHVEADPPVALRVGNATAEGALDVAVDEDATWHGLSGVVRIDARRADPAQAVRLVARDAAGGYEFEWPAQPPAPRWLPGAPPLALVGLAAVAAAQRRASIRP